MKKKTLSKYLKRNFYIIGSIILLLGMITLVGYSKIKEDTKKTLQAGKTVEILYKAESEHWEWASELLYAITSKKVFTGATDSSQCELGKILNDEEQLKRNSDLKAIKEKIMTDHDNFHASAVLVQEALGKRDYDAAIKAYNSETVPDINALRDAFKEEISRAEKTKTDCQKDLARVIMLVSVACFIGVLAVIIQLVRIMRFLTKEVINNIAKLSEESVKLSEGSLALDFGMEAQTQEVENLRHALEFSVSELGEYVTAIDQTMARFADGDFRTLDEARFLGDFQNILTSFQKFQNKINTSLIEISGATDQIYAGSEQVSAGAQNLAQGTTEQAGSVVSLSETIKEISEHIKKSAENSNKVDLLGCETVSVIDKGTHEMGAMLTAIDNIEEASENISKIIKAIDDIAFQTNILALNAAVEAARAGEAGKGFSVVADEVRSLAQKSAEAAQSTTQLIASALDAVRDGKEKANVTSDVFAEISEKSHEVINIVHLIREALQKQSIASDSILAEINQISSVVQMNSATSEESAAASEELSSQTHVLNELIGQFKVIDD